MNSQEINERLPLPLLSLTLQLSALSPAPGREQSSGFSPVYPFWLHSYASSFMCLSTPRLLLLHWGKTATPLENHRLYVTDNWSSLLAAGRRHIPGRAAWDNETGIINSLFYFKSLISGIQKKYFISCQTDARLCLPWCPIEPAAGMLHPLMQRNQHQDNSSWERPRLPR